MIDITISISNRLFLYGKYDWWILLYIIWIKKYNTKLITPRWKPDIATRWDIPNDEHNSLILWFILVARNRAEYKDEMSWFECCELIYLYISFLVDVGVSSIVKAKLFP